MKKVIDADIAICIETFEHNTDEEINACLSKLEVNYIAFSSTPHVSTDDKKWGHVNLKTKEEWIKLMKKHGYVYESDLTITNWAMLFKRKFEE